MISNKFRTTLKDNGLEQVAVAQGDVFNADYHEAITQNIPTHNFTVTPNIKLSKIELWFIRMMFCALSILSIPINSNLFKTKVDLFFDIPQTS